MKTKHKAVVAGKARRYWSPHWQTTKRPSVYSIVSPKKGLRPGDMVKVAGSLMLVIVAPGRGVLGATTLGLVHPRAVGDRLQHKHRFRCQSMTGKEADFACRCGERKVRVLTKAESRRFRNSILHDSGTHKYWHAFLKRLEKRFPEMREYHKGHLINWPVGGWETMEFMRKEAERHRTHVVTCRIDDGMHMNSDVHFLVHASPQHKKPAILNGQKPVTAGGWMGVSMIYCPQGGKATVGFLYPNHVENMIAALKKVQKLQRKYGLPAWMRDA